MPLFGKSSFFHRSERREREERWANKSEQTKKPEPLPENANSEQVEAYNAQSARHEEAKAYYRDLKTAGYKRPDAPPEDWDNRPSRKEIDEKFDRPKHIQEVERQVTEVPDYTLSSAPTLNFSSASDFMSSAASALWTIGEQSAQRQVAYESSLREEDNANSSENCRIM